MKLAVLSPLLGLALSLATRRALADDFRGDLAAIRAFLEADKSYSQAARAEAEAAFAQLKTRAANMSPAAFQLAVAHIAAPRAGTCIPPGAISGA